MNTPLFDVSLSFEERIDWLLQNLTVEEKLGWMGSRIPGCERLGIVPFGLGGEAAHGVQGRNDQFQISAPDYTTSFPQPVGLCSTWDPELLEKCGEVVGVEARVVNKRYPGGRGLSRWAPTVDLLRDPRWGRNEEAYSEDPVLAGTMASAYIRGMQGTDEKYIRCAATLKHFYANNVEVGRVWKNSTIDPRNRYELYLEPFRRCIEGAKAQGVMTAYNRINGKVGILNDEVQRILKDQYGLTHAVGDGGAMNLVVTGQHYYGNQAEAIAAALHAGVDGMSDGPNIVDPAAREAYELGLITEADLDRAIRSKMMVAMRAGHFDGDVHPYAHYTEADICTAEADALALKCAEENLVLLKNDDLLPLAKEKTALIGSMAESWYQDWYGGEPPCKKTIRDGFDALNVPYTSFDGWNRVKLMFGDMGITVGEDGSVKLSDTPDVFAMEDWGENDYTFRCIRTGKYLCMHMPPDAKNELGCDRVMPFNWFVLEIFHLEQTADGQHLLNCFHWPVTEVNGALTFGKEYAGTPMTIEVVEDGIARAATLAKAHPQVVLALGQCPMIPAKEERDRTTLLLPAHQRKLIQAVHQANPKCVLVLGANYPHALPYAAENVPAILLSATGSQQFGTAIANGLFGAVAPAGRLNMTWVKEDAQLPPIDDYDIIRGGRTYRYFEGEALYPFGHGLTYTTFKYADFSAEQKDGMLTFSFTVENTGSRASDEVAQVYAIAPASRVKKPLRQLLAFQRLHDVQPGEKHQIVLTAPVEELRFYDVISQRLMVEAGKYRFFAGGSSVDEAVAAMLDIPGETIGKRDMKKLIPADHYDDCANTAILQGMLGYACVCPQPGAERASVTYRDCDFTEECGLLSLRLMSVAGGKVTVLLDGQEIGTWEGDTRTCEHRSSPPMDRFAHVEIEARARERQPIWEDIDFFLPEEAGTALTLRLEGDIRVSFLRTKNAPGERKIRLGIAN